MNFTKIQSVSVCNAYLIEVWLRIQKYRQLAETNSMFAPLLSKLEKYEQVIKERKQLLLSPQKHFISFVK